ncbi:MAG: VanZ family protein, partial [Verrucomicrobia bacterium]|nr:VanZ family protein [Verrucomicrobiota bacterium]
ASSRSRVAGPEIVNIDKVAHFMVYGLLATLVCRLGRGWRALAWALVAVSAFGATDEWHQTFVPGRSSEFADWIADTLGAALAVLLYARWARYRQWLERPLGRGRIPVSGHAAMTP